MNSAIQAWKLLNEAKGTYTGKGTNHEEQPFTGKLSLSEGYPDKVLTLKYSATGNNREIYHEEVTWVGLSISGELIMYVTSNNHPGVTPHTFDRIENLTDVKNLVFRFGDIKNTDSFREEISIGLHSDGSLTHHYSWGMPGSEFKARSGCRMVRA